MLAVPQEAAKVTEAEQPQERLGPELSAPNQDTSKRTLDDTIAAHPSDKVLQSHFHAFLKSPDLGHNALVTYRNLKCVKVSIFYF